jgi:excinuclease ABC subunit C
MKETALQNRIKDFPKNPGVYLMKDDRGTIIYVGKAKILRNRVRSYFAGTKDPKTRVLVSKIRTIDYLITESEYEALILENNLIKEYSPRYNINLKDGKTYPVIRITADEYPRIFRTRRIIQDGSRYFGPYTNVAAIQTYLEMIDKLYPLRKCRGPLKKRSSPCLYYHIGKCPGPCAGLVSREDYQAQADKAATMLAKPPEELQKELEAHMQEASKGLKFEKAAEYRDLLRAMDSIFVDQKVIDYDLETRDYLGWYAQDSYHSFVVLQMRGGRLAGTDMFRSQGFGSDEEDLVQFITRYYSEFRRFPERLFLPPRAPQEDIQRFFREELGASETTVLYASGDRDGAVMNMATENARQDCLKRIMDLGSRPALEELQRILSLPTLPERIEGFDIAQLHGKHTVAAMVSYFQGRPDPGSYRKFHIRSINGGIDDFESIREAVARRYTRVINEDLPRPDLILIDGGKGQLSGAKGILDALGLDIPILGLAKREEEIFLPGEKEPIILPPGHPALRILQGVRDEAHRFGTTFNQQLRTSDLKLDTLEGIPGLGKVRSQRLMKKFGGLKGIAQASIHELSRAGGFGNDLAQSIQERLALEGFRDTDESIAAESTPAYPRETKES